MIVTREGRIDIAIGETFAYNGRIYECILDLKKGAAGCEDCALREKMACRAMECRAAYRSDGMIVVFVKLKQEGGEDERK